LAASLVVAIAVEVPLVLTRLAPAWRPLFATAIWTGMRKGELLGLRKSDLDLEARTITIRCSYDSDTTKGGHVDVIPIADPLKPFLREALLASRSVYVFPAADGSMRPEDTPLQDVLRRALARAGLVNGYDHGCRRCKGRSAPHVEHHADAARRHCPACGMKLWPKPVHRPIRFHDLRGTTATLLARAGAPLVVAQRILRHSDPRLTANVYSRVDLGDLRAGLNRIDIPAMPMLVAASSPPPLVPLVSPRDSLGKTKGRDSLNHSNEITAPEWSGRLDLNQRPLAPQGASAFMDTGSPLVTASHALDESGVSPLASSDRLAPAVTATPRTPSDTTEAHDEEMRGKHENAAQRAKKRGRAKMGSGETPVQSSRLVL